MSSLLIKTGRLWDGLADAPRANQFLTVEGGRIAAIGPQSELGAEAGRFARVIDLGPDATLMPGLINMHVHMGAGAGPDVYHELMTEGVALQTARAVENLRRALSCGTTTVRDCGTLNEVSFAVRHASEAGLIPAPRVIAAGHGITTTAGHCWYFSHECDNEREVRAAVRTQVKAGADFIKLFATGGRLTPGSNTYAAQFTAEELTAGAEEARRLGKTVASHALGKPGVATSIAAGVTTIEHCVFQAPPPPGVQGDVVDYDPAMARQIAEKGIYVVPTLRYGASRFLEDPDFVPSPAQQTYYDGLPRRFQLYTDLVEAGVQLVSGSDSGMTHTFFDDFPDDLIFAQEGTRLPPAYVLKTGTSLAADALHRDDLGVLAPGKAADLLGVAGNPLERIRDLKQARFIASRGRVALAPQA